MGKIQEGTKFTKAQKLIGQAIPGSKAKNRGGRLLSLFKKMKLEQVVCTECGTIYRLRDLFHWTTTKRNYKKKELYINRLKRHRPNAISWFYLYINSNKLNIEKTNLKEKKF